MNKRARNRLIGVTAIVLIVIGVVLSRRCRATGAYSKTVDDVLKDKTLVGERVRVARRGRPGLVGQEVEPDELRHQGRERRPGRRHQGLYNGTAPNTFGDGVVAIVTGDARARRHDRVERHDHQVPVEVRVRDRRDDGGQPRRPTRTWASRHQGRPATSSPTRSSPPVPASASRSSDKPDGVRRDRLGDLRGRGARRHDRRQEDRRQRQARARTAPSRRPR